MARNEKVLLVANPISGAIDKTEIISSLSAYCREGGIVLLIYYTTGKKVKERLTEIYANEKPDRILVVGGDGTLKLVAEVLGEDIVPIGLFPAGSANGLAENLALPTDIEALATVAFGENYVELDCINVNEELCLHISDIGLNAELIKNYEEGNIRGKLGYFLQSIPTLIQSNFPFSFEIEIGGKRFNREAVLIAVANAKKYGTGATINPDGKLNDGRFEILVFKKFDIPEILRTFQENVNPKEDFLEIFPAEEAQIQSEQALPFQVDGEYRGEVKCIRAKMSGLKLRMAVPKSLTDH